MNPDVFPPRRISFDIRTEYTPHRCIANNDNSVEGPIVAVSPARNVRQYQSNVSFAGMLFSPRLPLLMTSFTAINRRAKTG